MADNPCFTAHCPNRLLFAEIADKWTMMILTVLERHPRRFNDIKRLLEGISQKSLTQTLRRLERNGIVTREVISSSPVAVQYELTDIGQSLLQPYKALYCWTVEKLPDVNKARKAFDQRQPA